MIGAISSSSCTGGYSLGDENSSLCPDRHGYGASTTITNFDLLCENDWMLMKHGAALLIFGHHEQRGVSAFSASVLPSKPNIPFAN